MTHWLAQAWFWFTDFEFRPVSESFQISQILPPGVPRGPISQRTNNLIELQSIQIFIFWCYNQTAVLSITYILLHPYYEVVLMNIVGLLSRISCDTLLNELRCDTLILSTSMTSVSGIEGSEPIKNCSLRRVV